MVELCIRLSEEEEAFVYSLQRDGVVIETAAVPVGALAQPVECEFYGGSETMD